MRKASLLLAASAAAISSGAATAADIRMAAPPVYEQPAPREFSGWYLRGEIGFSNQRVKDSKMTDNRYDPLLNFQQTNTFSTAGIYGVGLGYTVNNWLRFDVSGQYRGNSSYRALETFQGYASDGSIYYAAEEHEASKSEIVVMANAYVDLGTWWNLTPYIGAGAGMARVTIADFTDLGTVNLVDLGGGNVIRGQQARSLASGVTSSRWNFAWALHAGVGYQVTPNMTMELAYSYMNLGDGFTGPITTYEGFTRGVPMRFRDIISHDLKLGVRWNLDAPGFVPSRPPLMTRG